MAINTKKVISRAEQKEEKTKATLYLNKEIYKEFKNLHQKGKIPPISNIINVLLKDFLKDFKK